MTVVAVPGNTGPMGFLVTFHGRRQVPSKLGGLYAQVSSPIYNDIAFGPWVSRVRREGAATVIDEEGVMTK